MASFNIYTKHIMDIDKKIKSTMTNMIKNGWDKEDAAIEIVNCFTYLNPEQYQNYTKWKELENILLN